MSLHPIDESSLTLLKLFLFSGDWHQSEEFYHHRLQAAAEDQVIMIVIIMIMMIMMMIIMIRLPESVTLTAEGNCCWEVFRRPHYKVK